jgi:glycosyltransferase involved in cell wall biosynthesis
MTVVIDARHLGPELSGIDRYLIGLVTGLASLEAAPRCTILCRPGGLPALVEAAAGRAHLACVPCDVPIWSPLSQWVLPRLLRRAACRVYHCPYPHAPLLGSGLAQVLTLHDMTSTTHRAENRRALKSSFPRLWDAWLALQCRRAQAILTVSRDARDAIVRLLPAAAGKVHVVHNGVAPGRTHVTEAQLRERHGLQGRIVSYVGRQDPHKNLVALVTAFAAVRRQAADRITLVVAGRLDARYPEARRTARAFGLDGDVRFTGYIPEDERVALLRASSVFVFPSRSEGFGLPPLEAMAEGVPVVALRCTSMPEVLGDAALLVDDDHERIGAAILDVLRDEHLAGRLRRAGRQRAERFSWAACARGHVALYERWSGSAAPRRGAAHPDRAEEAVH